MASSITTKPDNIVVTVEIKNHKNEPRLEECRFLIPLSKDKFLKVQDLADAVENRYKRFCKLRKVDCDKAEVVELHKLIPGTPPRPALLDLDDDDPVGLLGGDCDVVVTLKHPAIFFSPVSSSGASVPVGQKESLLQPLPSSSSSQLDFSLLSSTSLSTSLPNSEALSSTYHPTGPPLLLAPIDGKLLLDLDETDLPTPSQIPLLPDPGLDLQLFLPGEQKPQTAAPLDPIPLSEGQWWRIAPVERSGVIYPPFQPVNLTGPVKHCHTNLVQRLRLVPTPEADTHSASQRQSPLHASSWHLSSSSSSSSTTLTTAPEPPIVYGSTHFPWRRYKKNVFSKPSAPWSYLFMFCLTNTEIALTLSRGGSQLNHTVELSPLRTFLPRKLKPRVCVAKFPAEVKSASAVSIGELISKSGDESWAPQRSSQHCEFRAQLKVKHNADQSVTYTIVPDMKITKHDLVETPVGSAASLHCELTCKQHCDFCYRETKAEGKRKRGREETDVQAGLPFNSSVESHFKAPKDTRSFLSPHPPPSNYHGGVNESAVGATSDDESDTDDEDEMPLHIIVTLHILNAGSVTLLELSEYPQMTVGFLALHIEHIYSEIHSAKPGTASEIEVVEIMRNGALLGFEDILGDAICATGAEPAQIHARACFAEPSATLTRQLFVATGNGLVAWIRSLCEKKADVNTKDSDGRFPMHVASQNNNVDTIRTLVELKGNINAAKPKGVTPFYRAAYDGYVDSIRVLHELKAIINIPTNYGATPVWAAALRGHDDCIRVLHELKANVHTPDNDGWSAAAIAAWKGKSGCIRVLSTLKADLNASSEEGDTPVSLAAAKGHIDCIRVLYELKADIHVPRSGRTAVRNAAQNGHLDCIRILHELGTDITADGEMSLRIAALNGHADCIRLLGELKADVTMSADAVRDAAKAGQPDCIRALHDLKADLNASDGDGYRALWFAAQKGHVKCIRVLHELKADMSISNRKGTDTVLIAASNAHSDCVRVLHELKADINAVSEGKSAVHLATKDHFRTLERVKCIRTLHELKANVHALTPQGESGILIAAEMGGVDCIRVLAELKADVNRADVKGCTPLHKALQNHRKDCVRVLSELKADVNLRDSAGLAPVFIASQQGNLDYIRILIEHKANVNVPDNKGVTPLFLAAREGKYDCLRALIEAKADVNHPTNEELTAVHAAAEGGTIDCVRGLAEAKANVNAARHNGETAVFLAARLGHTDCIRILAEYKADVNTAKDNGLTPLSIALKRGHTESVELLKRLSPDKELHDLAVAIAVKFVDNIDPGSSISRSLVEAGLSVSSLSIQAGTNRVRSSFSESDYDFFG